MTRIAVLACGICVAWPSSAGAHRLDEYLQATRMSLARDAVELEIDLTPGVQIAGRVIPLIDRDADGRLSDAERRRYAERVLAATALELDRRHVPVTLSAYDFPSVDDLRGGTASIRVRARANADASSPGQHTLHFVNLHEPEISAYLVNAMAPPDDVRITSQRRDPWQREFTLTFSRGASPAGWGRLGLFFSGIGVMMLLVWQTHRVRSRRGSPASQG